MPAAVGWNLEGALRWASGRLRFQAGLAVQNLFGKRYVDFLDTYKQYFPAQGRSLRVSFSTLF